MVDDRLEVSPRPGDEASSLATIHGPTTHGPPAATQHVKPRVVRVRGAIQADWVKNGPILSLKLVRLSSRF